MGTWRKGRGWGLEGRVAETMIRNGREEREGMGEVGMERMQRGGEERGEGGGQKRGGDRRGVDRRGKAQKRRNCVKLALAHLNVLCNNST